VCSSDLTPSRVQTALKTLRDGASDAPGLSAQTCLHYLRSVKQFSAWLVRDRRTKDDALAHLAGFNVASDRRHRRRALSDDEIERLVTAAEKAPAFRLMSGPDRALVYAFAAATGLRANELRSLTPASFDLDSDPATVTLEAGCSKHRREDVQLIPDELAAMLRPWLADKPVRRGGCFPLPDKTSKMLRADLDAARMAWLAEAQTPQERQTREASAFLSYRDAGGLVFDFHALRGQFITAVVRGGASVKVAMDLARHSDPRLTLGAYTHLATADKRAALASVPVVRPRSATGGEAEKAKATGTYGAPPSTSSGQAANSPSSGPDWRAARAAHAQRGPATSCNIGQHRGLGSDLRESGGNGLKRPEKQGITGNKAAPRARSSMDRASVFGTEGYRFDSCRA